MQYTKSWWVYLVIVLAGYGCATDDLVTPSSVGQLPTSPDDNTDSRDTAPEILQIGEHGLLLRGTVLTPNKVIAQGDVFIVDNLIACVDVDCTHHPQASEATWINTRGVISPGLIDAHNHIAYNFLPRWTPSPFRLFSNRYQWADEEAYELFVQPYARHRSRGTHYCPAAKWGELRSLVHATTTVQGQSFQQACVNWGVRNADHYHNLGHNHMRTYIGSVRDINDEQAQNYIESFEATTDPITRFAVHMTEGVGENHLHDEFDSFAGRDSRPNRHHGVSLLEHGTAVLIHSMLLTEQQLGEVFYTNSKIVWSPSSNIALYGVTAPIERILEWNIITGIGPDWTVSGEYDMLSELRVAQEYGQNNGIEALTAKRLWEMATRDGAVVVGLEEYIGRLEVGFRADIAVFSRRHEDPYQAIIDSEPQDIQMVIIDGAALFGDHILQDIIAANEYCEPFSICGNDKFICVQESPEADNRKNETLNDIRTQLYNILEGIGYSEDEQYERGDELLDLVECFQ